MSFADRLAAANPDPSGRRWVYVPYDQLTDAVGPLAGEPSGLGIVLVESRHKAGRRPYHQQKLALVLTNLRHFALEQAARGVAVDYRFSSRPYAEVLREVAAERGPLAMMEAAERELRLELAPLVDDGLIEVLDHAGWLTTDADFAATGGPPWRMDAFYRGVRQRTGLLMVDGKPEGGRYSHDGDNREPWSGLPWPPEPPRFPPDAITEEVCDLVRTHFADHPGTLVPDALPATPEDAEKLWAWALGECMTHFGTYEDAMSTRSRGLFHTRIAPLLNLHRLLPSRVVADVAASEAPLNSREGFIRQVLGWREFVRHVHRATQGLTELDGKPLSDPLHRDQPLPPAFWEDSPSGLACLDDAVSAVWDEGWTHHIQRLMVLANLATLLDVRPQEVSDWFWVGFVDAYDWVVEPNVLAMGTFGVGDLMTTKPYVSGANYLAKMGDACESCAFHPKKTCPITPMYWAFLARHRDAFSEVDRMNLVMGSLRRRSDARRQEDAEIFAWVRDTLARGERLQPRRNR
ncbi:MAG: deoxyribodipyrimidine photolyase [Deltaproteobacteria bacterium]|nr:MAG: deoxyribodipyrimidine photolyase [Deltaproteobacteria bacterium]